MPDEAKASVLQQVIFASASGMDFMGHILLLDPREHCYRLLVPADGGF